MQEDEFTLFSLGRIGWLPKEPHFLFARKNCCPLQIWRSNTPFPTIRPWVAESLSEKRSIPLSIVILCLFACISNKTIPQFNRSCSTRLWLLRFHCFSLRKTESFHFLLLASQAGSKFSEELCFFASLKSEQIESIEKTARVFSTCSLFKKRFTEFTACLKGASNGKHWKNSWSEEKE